MTDSELWKEFSFCPAAGAFKITTTKYLDICHIRHTTYRGSLVSFVCRSSRSVMCTKLPLTDNGSNGAICAKPTTCSIDSMLKYSELGYHDVSKDIPLHSFGGSYVQCALHNELYSVVFPLFSGYIHCQPYFS